MEDLGIFASCATEELSWEWTGPRLCIQLILRCVPSSCVCADVYRTSGNAASDLSDRGTRSEHFQMQDGHVGQFGPPRHPLIPDTSLGSIPFLLIDLFTRRCVAGIKGRINTYSQKLMMRSNIKWMDNKYLKPHHLCHPPISTFQNQSFKVITAGNIRSGL